MIRIEIRTASLVLALSLALGGPTAAFAQGSPSQTNTAETPTDEVIMTLRDHGYRIVENQRTWLGRQRVIAEKDGARRELVFNPGTGEILRDYVVKIVPADAIRLSRDASGVSLDHNTGVTATRNSAPGLSVSESLSTNRSGDFGAPFGTPVEGSVE